MTEPAQTAREMVAVVDSAPRPALLVGYYAGANLGDELLLEVLLQGCDHSRGTVDFLYRRPEVLARLHGATEARAVPWRIRPAARAAFRSRSIVVGGGGLWGMDTNLNVLALSAILLACRLARKRVLLVGVGYYDSARALGRVAARLAGLAAHVVIPRDDESFRNFSGISADVRPGVDLAFAAADDHFRAGHRRPLGAVGRPTVAVSWRRFRAADANPWHDAVLELPRRLPGHRVVFLPFEPASADPDGYARAERCAAEHANAELVPFDHNPLDLLRDLREGQPHLALVAPQYHGILLAHLAGVPFFPVAYDNKVSQLLAQVGADAVPIARVSVDELVGFVAGALPGSSPP